MSQDVELWIRELGAAGWRKYASTVWKSQSLHVEGLDCSEFHIVEPQSSVPAPAGATQNTYEQHGHLPECIYWQNDEDCNCDWKGWPKLAGSLAERPVTPQAEPGATTLGVCGAEDRSHGLPHEKAADCELWMEFSPQAEPRVSEPLRKCLDCGIEVTACNSHVLADQLVKAVAGEIPFSQVQERCPRCEVMRCKSLSSTGMGQDK